jgi:two-component system, cell cycle response regulator
LTQAADAFGDRRPSNQAHRRASRIPHRAVRPSVDVTPHEAWRHVGERGAALLLCAWVLVVSVVSLAWSSMWPLWLATPAMGLCGAWLGRRTRVWAALLMTLMGFLTAAVVAGAGAAVAAWWCVVMAAVFAVGSWTLHAAVQQARAAENVRADRYIRHRVEEARWFRQLSRQGTSTDDNDDKIGLAQALAMRDGLFRTLRLLERSLRVEGIAVYRAHAHGTHLDLWEQRITDDGGFVPTLVLGARGAVGGVVGMAARQLHAVRVSDSDGALVSGHRRPGGSKPTAAMAVPLKDRGVLAGVLVVDGIHAFDDADEACLMAFADTLQSVWQTEQLLDEVARDRGRLLQVAKASRALAGRIDQGEVAAAAFSAVRNLVTGANADVALYMVDVVGEGQAQTLSLMAQEGLHLPTSATVLEGTRVWQALQALHVLPAHDAQDLGAAPKNILQPGDALDAREVRVWPVMSHDRTLALLLVATSSAMNVSQREALAALADVLAPTLQAVQVHAQLALQATTDGLTGLKNRATFDVAAEAARQRTSRTGQPLTLILSDIDHFKSVNDVYGHGTGDDVLRAVAKSMQGCARNIDVVARYGGEELVVVCEGTDLAGAQILAERMRMALKSLLFHTDKGPLHVTSSFGVAEAHTNEAVASLLARADAALYQAKQGGRDRVVCARVDA